VKLCWQRSRGLALRGARLALLGAVLALAGAATPAASATTGSAPDAGVSVSEGSAVFPARSLVLSAPHKSSLKASEVHLSENGRAVAEAVVTPIARASAGDFGIVLAIDTSASMKGRSLENAMSAARSLAHRRTGHQELGIVEFDQTPRAVLPLTVNSADIAGALASTPRVGGGTHIFDALALALRQLHSAHVASGAVILLSDGADRGSAESEQAVAAAARAAHVSLYTVGVRDAAFDSSSLRTLAEDGGGQFLITSSSGLRELFAKLDAGLVNRFVVHYRSHEPPGQRVQVRVGVDGVRRAAVLAYTTPRPPRALGAAHPKNDSFWSSTLALLVVSLGSALLIGLAIASFISPRMRRDTVRHRVARFTAGAAASSAEDHGDGVSPRLLRLEGLLERTRWWPGFKADVEIAHFDRPAIELVAICALASTVAALLFAVGVGIAVLGVVMLALGPLALHSLVRRRLRKRRAEFAAQLPNHLQELASTMRAGHSLVSGIRAMTQSANEPSRSEWARVIADEKLGMPLESALHPLAERMACADIDQVALVASLQHRSGGNMAEVLERLADGVRERADLRRELDSLTAQARLSRWVVTGLPIGVLLILTALNPSYTRPLFHTSGGQLMLGLAIVLITSGSLVMRRITDIGT
jgi:tight adherence protein B